MKVEKPSEVQPVDEEIGPADIIKLGEDTATQMLYFREVGIWRYGDYAHLVLARYPRLAEVAIRKPKRGAITSFVHNLKSFLRKEMAVSTEREDYLGPDVLARSARDVGRAFDVSTTERHRLADSWHQSKDKYADIGPSLNY